MCVFFLKEENKPIRREVYRNTEVKVVSTFPLSWTEVRFFALDKCVCPSYTMSEVTSFLTTKGKLEITSADLFIWFLLVIIQSIKCSYAKFLVSEKSMLSITCIQVSVRRIVGGFFKLERSPLKCIA